MRLPFHAARSGPGSWAWRLIALGVLLPGGCAFHGWWDRVTSRDLTWNERLWSKDPEPLEAIRSSSDGAKRAKAYASLREPSDPKTRDLYLQILEKTALEDREPMCRIGALRALGHFKDPRVIDILEAAHKQPLYFTSDFNSNIRKEAIASLEAMNDDPRARKVLIAVAKQPRSEGSSVEQQHVIDERLLAINALGRSKNFEAVETLLYVLETEKNVALRYRAHEALQTATGKNLPPDPVVWKEALNNPNALARNPSFIERVFPGNQPQNRPVATEESQRENQRESRPGVLGWLTGRKQEPVQQPIE